MGLGQRDESPAAEAGRGAGVRGSGAQGPGLAGLGPRTCLGCIRTEWGLWDLEILALGTEGEVEA